MSRSLPLLAALLVLSAASARAQGVPEAPAQAAAPAAPAPAQMPQDTGGTPDPSNPHPVPLPEGAGRVTGAAAQAAGASATAEQPVSVAVLPLEANEAGRDSAPGVTSLIASRLSESPRLRVIAQRDIQAALDAERQRQLLGKSCDRGPCLQELSSLTGARYVIVGRLDRFGSQYLLTASLVDTLGGRGLARPRAEAPDADALLRTAEAVADQLLAALVSPGEASAAAHPLLGGTASPPGGGLSLGLRINNSFIDKLASLNPGVDLEVGYWFHPEWLGFVQVGFTLVRAGGDGPEGKINVLPSVVGARHYHRLEHALRPYWGFGLGVQLSFGDFGIFQNTGPLPTVIGFVGAEYLIAGHVGLQLEVGTNVAQAVLGLSEGGLGDGLNLDLNAGIAYHF